MSKIINSFPYAVALAKSMSHDIWKYEPRHRNSIQVFVSRAAPWKINRATRNSIQVFVSRAAPWKINRATTYGKLLIIFLIKTGSNFFWQFFSYNYRNAYNANISDFRCVYSHVKRELMSQNVKP